MFTKSFKYCGVITNQRELVGKYSLIICVCNRSIQKKLSENFAQKFGSYFFLILTSSFFTLFFWCFLCFYFSPV
ncbi:MAG: hypothetical protein EBU33_09230 [Sphingobacteriia bacterium]|nr:hypothetical protein [Sphingobacteriia bacterium]